jgi:hypothetical protein
MLREFPGAFVDGAMGLDRLSDATVEPTLLVCEETVLEDVCHDGPAEHVGMRVAVTFRDQPAREGTAEYGGNVGGRPCHEIGDIAYAEALPS